MTVAMGFKIHPLALRVPGMTEEEFAALVDDVAEHGLRDEITLFDGRILDGRHRYRACVETGVDPRFEEYEGDEPAAFVLSRNVHRRSLTTGQLAMLALDFMPDLEAEAEERQKRLGRETGGVPSAPLSPTVDKGLASEFAAEKVGGVSARAVQRAKKVAKADPDLAAQVAAGEVTLNSAEEKVKAKKQKGPTRDGTRKRGSIELVQNVIEMLLGVPVALNDIDTDAAIYASDAPLQEWDKQLTEVIRSLNSLRGEIRKVTNGG